MSGRLRVARGYVFGSEIIWIIACGLAVVFPTWLGGRVAASFVDEAEAQAFVAAADLTFGGGARFLVMTPVYAEAN
jgi:hypothetical protein